ncbi:MAG: DUF4783 domain-containing protein [Parabacteroides sp.]|nr:DUF4783 domain-containing protein [Parabacteroides sp.]
MKRFLLTCALLCAFCSLQAADIAGITQAFKEGKAETLVGKLAATIDLALPEQTLTCEGEQAIQALNRFFGQHKPATFTVVHHADKSDNGFVVAKLHTEAGDYRVNITYKADNNTAIIQSIRIE